MVVWPQKVSKWEYLDDIVNKTKQTSDVTLGLLVGENCAKVLEPYRITPSQG